MMTTGGAATIINDLTSLGYIAKAVADPVTLEKIRNEFQEYSDQLKVQEATIQDQIKKSLVSISDAQVKWDELAERQTILDTLEQTLDNKSSKLDSREKSLDDRESALQIAKSDLFNKQQLLDKSQVQKEQAWNSQVQTKTVELQKRETSVSQREASVQVREDRANKKETTLFKQSQLAAEFVNSLSK